MCNFTNISASWPSISNSRVQLFGLFDKAENASEITEFTLHSRAMFKAAILLSQQYNITIAGHFITWQMSSTDGNTMVALGDTCRAMSSSDIFGIVGPVFSQEAHQIADFANLSGIPVVSYSATDFALSDRNNYPTFYRTSPSDNTLALALATLFIRYNWTSCIIIYQNDAYGVGGTKILSETFLKYNIEITNLIVFDVVTLSIQGNLKSSLSNSASRIVILWSVLTYIEQILRSALQADVVGPHFTWILTSSISLDSFNQIYHSKLIGILTVEPVTGSIVDAPVNTTLLSAAYQVWKKYDPESFPVTTRVSPYALFAFDATWALIQALQEFCSSIESSSSSCLSYDGPSFCFDRRLVYSHSLLKTMNLLHFLGVSGLIQFDMNVTDRSNGSYYYVQNVQYTSDHISFTPVLKYDTSNGWKTYSKTQVIIWPGNSLNPSTGRAMLAGVTLRIGVIESIPFTIVTNVVDSSGQNVTKITGYVPDLLEYLRDRMGFVADVQLVPSSLSYSGLVQAVANGDYDIAVGDITVTSARRELAAFSNSISDNSMRILIRKTATVPVDLLSYLKPFSPNLWLLVLTAMVFASIILCIFERKDNEALQNRSIISSGAMSLWFAFGTLVGYGADFHAQTAAGRLISVGLYMLSLVLVASYTANLASDLTILKTKDLIDGIDDMKNGKIPYNRIGIRVGTAGEDYYLREISGGNRNFYSLKSRQEMYDALLAGLIDASFMDSGTAEYVTNNIYCNLTLIGEDFDKSAFGIVTPKQWLYAKDLDVNILSLRETGILDNLKKKWFEAKLCPTANEPSTALGLESLSGLFLTFAIICVMSLGVFVWYNRDTVQNYLPDMLARKILLRRTETYIVNFSIKNQTSTLSSPPGS
ncbi:unnamed protein product [Adineta ricciae]|uniref:Ionotropic glutamate receptor C-terminal domain-containing protein n=1 Tax=Adineta ricciae TaxID=249248 RepID=A0A815CDZ5_ADIRI|nr:unnamed protein product [Adineta ricciae]CAF1283887.1 unnamed protein product [Adineta ricciae]